MIIMRSMNILFSLHFRTLNVTHIDHFAIQPLAKYSVSMRCWYVITASKATGFVHRSKLQNRLCRQSIGLSLHSDYWQVITYAHSNIRFKRRHGGRQTTLVLDDETRDATNIWLRNTAVITGCKFTGIDERGVPHCIMKIPRSSFRIRF